MATQSDREIELSQTNRGVGGVCVGVVDQFNDWGGGDVTYLSPFWEGTARK